jgi:hypothetical protein
MTNCEAFALAVAISIVGISLLWLSIYTTRPPKGQAVQKRMKK